MTELTFWNQLRSIPEVALHLFLSAPQPPTSLFLQQQAPLASSASFTSLLATVVSPARHTALNLQLVAQSDSLGANANVTREFGCHALALAEESGRGWKGREREVDKAEGVR